MKKDYSVEFCRRLETKYKNLGLFGPYTIKGYAPEDIIEYAACVCAPIFARALYMGCDFDTFVYRTLQSTF